jgi:hypothetical protein
MSLIVLKTCRRSREIQESLGVVLNAKESNGNLLNERMSDSGATNGSPTEGRERERRKNETNQIATMELILDFLGIVTPHQHSRFLRALRASFSSDVFLLGLAWLLISLRDLLSSPHCSLLTLG